MLIFINKVFTINIILIYIVLLLTMYYQIIFDRYMDNSNFIVSRPSRIMHLFVLSTITSITVYIFSALEFIFL